jgi:hypothetical protein
MNRQKFNVSFMEKDDERRERHGLPWNQRELEALRRLFLEGHDLYTLCTMLQRPSAGVIPKLKLQGLISYDPRDDNYYRVEMCDEPQPKQEPIMNPSAPIIEVKTTVFIGGVDASKLTDMAIFTKIAELEATVCTWDAINRKPAKLVKLIEATKLDIERLANFVDARE